ncbi:MAG: carboxypeptidase-like regulatory domain-containing protein [Ignavibacteriales bacterium]|nr:carboxypeptidase-like regulatory domain-containing protein [Ignavibacteriales bacterium]
MKSLLTQLYKKILHSIVLTISVAVLCWSGNTGKIAGKVIDRANGEPLIGANVVVKGLKLGASTDINGDYFILNIPPGSYTLTASLLGYEAVNSTNVSVIIDRTTTKNFELETSLIEGDEVNIVAERPVVDKDLTASEQIVTSAMLENSGALAIKDVLEGQAGIFSDNSNLAWQRGATRGYIRGSSIVQAVYMIDNLSVNSGLVSDNYSGFNTSTIEQISVLTGGYNAEYGEGRSAVVNIVSKEAGEGIHGTFLARMRPAGVYHFGRNMYSKQNNDYVSTGIEYWIRESQDENSRYYTMNPDSLLLAWRKQTTPNDVMGNYANRPEYEYEGTLIGGVTEELSFLASGRFKQGVGIFPQAIPYNPEFNIQGYLNYKFSPEFKVRLGGFVGGYESADYTSTNFNTSEMGQEAGWLAPMRIDEQYARAKYNLFGAPFRQWPEYRRWSQLYGKITHVLNERSLYEVTISYLKDRMDRSDRDGRVPDTLWLADQVSMHPRYTLQAYYHTWTKNFSQSYQIKGDYTNQVTTTHNIKAGFTFKSHDFYYENFAAESRANRVNEMNVFDGNPYEGNMYVQDKIEFPGLIVNIGVRSDFFNQNRNAPKNMYDPLAIQPGTPGHEPGTPVGIPGTPERERTKLQLAIAPRLGISHPMSENAVLHFVYGHFYQRPSWTKMFGFPFRNETTVKDSVLNPYAKQPTYMDEWQGYYGNAKLGYERTIQYELGIDYNIADMIKVDVTGYYKDASREAEVITGVYPALTSSISTKALMVSNAGYSDVRGIETKVDSRFDGMFNFGLSHEVYWSFEGEVGFSRLYEPGSTNINIPKGLRQGRGAWGNYQRIKGWANFSIAKDEGPEFGGVRPFSDINIYSNFWWRTGDQYTYHPPGDQSTEPNNMRWFNYYQIDLKVTKGFDLFGLETELSVDVKNVFDLKFLRLLYDDDLARYMENPNLPDSERLPKTYDFSEPNIWEWYSYEVPPRRIYFQITLKF